MNNSISDIARTAKMIVASYAFLSKDNGNISIVNIHPPYHAALIRPDGEMLETSMDDIEISMVTDYWQRNKKYMKVEHYAEVL